MPATPTGFQLQALPQPYSLPANLGRIDVPEIQGAFRTGIQNAQAMRVVGPQTQAALASYQQQQAEAENAAARAQALASYVKDTAALEGQANKSYQQARVNGVAGAAMSDIDTPMGRLPVVITSGGNVQPLLNYSPLLGQAMKGPQGANGITEVVSTIMDSDGVTRELVQRFGVNGFNHPVPIGPPFKREIGSGSTVNTGAVPIASQARSLGGATAPAPAQAAPLSVAAPVSQPTTPLAAASPATAPASTISVQATPSVVPAASTPASWMASTSDPSGKNQNQYTLPLGIGGKSEDEIVEKASAQSIPAVIPNEYAGTSPKDANASKTDARKRNRDFAEGMEKEMINVDAALDTVGRSFKINKDVTTFSKLPFIGTLFNEFRELIQPDFQALKALSAQPAISQAKASFGSRVTNFDLESLMRIAGNENMPIDVRKEAMASMIIGLQRTKEYDSALQNYISAYPTSSINEFNKRYTEYMKKNPLYIGTPGSDGFRGNDNMISFGLYNAIRNKGYANPIEVVAQNSDLVDGKGNFDYTKLKQAGEPWSVNPAPVASTSTKPETPMSEKTVSGTPNESDLRNWMVQWKNANPNKSKDDMKADLKRAFPDMKF